MESAEHQILLQWMDENLFHFSCKTINSNVRPGGVRLGAEQVLDLPYVSVRTLMAEGKQVGLDYLVNAGKDATYFKRVRQLIGEIDALESDTPDAKNSVADKYLAIITQHAEQGLHTVSPRLRQLLIPQGAAGYVAITPLASAGLSEHISAVSRKRQDARKIKDNQSPTIGFDRHVNSFSVGGSNPQNVGGRVRSMSRPLVFVNVPKLNPKLRAAFSLHYNGFRPSLPYDMVRRYGIWQKDVQDKNMTLALRAQESSLISPMLDAVRNQAQKAERSIHDYADEFLEPRQDALLEAFLSPTRNHADRRAQWLLNALDSFRFGANPDGTTIRLSFSPEERRRLHQLITEL
jgi:hypothetical protein